MILRSLVVLLVHFILLGASLAEQDPEALINAIKNNETRKAEALIAQGVDLAAADMIRLLLKKGAAPEKRENRIRYPAQGCGLALFCDRFLILAETKSNPDNGQLN